MGRCSGWVLGLAAGLLVVWVGLGVAAEPDPLGQYRARSLNQRFSAMSGMEVTRAGEPVDVGFFGGNAAEVFGDLPAALESMETFRTLRIAGTALWAAGLAVLLTEIVLLVTESDFLVEEVGGVQEIKRGPFLGMLIGGSALGLTGGIMMQGANGYLSDAVDRYNDDLARRLGGGSAGGALSAPGLSWRGTF